jgi:hypothetical protein
MTTDGGIINCSEKCSSMINMGDYLLVSPIIAIQMGGAYVVLGVQLLQSLGTTTLDLKKKIMRFSSKSKEIELGGIQGKPSKVISSNNMTKLIKKGHHGLLAKLCSLGVQTSRPSIPVDLQKVFDNHSKVFEEILKGFPPVQDHDHAIHLQPGSVPPNIRPYSYPYVQRSEIERMIKEMLEVDVIQTSQGDFSSPMVLVTQKEGSYGDL